MRKVEQYGFVKGGVLKILNKKRMEAEIKALPDMDVQITIKKKGKRSTPQNSYYWGVVVEEIRHELKRRGTRATPEEVHEALKLKFHAHREINTESGEVLLEIGQSTTELNKEEFAEYLERIIQWAGESLEIVIPEAGEQVKMFD